MNKFLNRIKEIIEETKFNNKVFKTNIEVDLKSYSMENKSLQTMNLKFNDLEKEYLLSKPYNEKNIELLDREVRKNVYEFIKDIEHIEKAKELDIDKLITKQRPMTVIEFEWEELYIHNPQVVIGECPNCHSAFLRQDLNKDYCCRCGQKLDWNKYY